HIVKREPANAQALKVIIELAQHPSFERQARWSWRRAMLRLPATQANVTLVEQYLAQEQVEDMAVIEYLQTMRQQIAEHRRLMADPHYRARLEGEELLEANKHS